MDLGIRGKTALVTGASQGIGRAIALGLAQEGARVLLVARSVEKLERLVQEIKASGGEAKAIPTDLSKGEELEGLLARIQSAGPIELFLANTGGPRPSPAQELSPMDFRQAADGLLYPLIRLVEGLLPGMKAQGFGRILAITSLAVKEPIENLALSNTLRAAVTGYLKTLSREVAPYGITVNMLAPGYTLTERVSEVFEYRAKEQGTSLEAALAQQARQIPAGRLGQPEEIADVALFLLSSRASYLTGQTVVVDGGFTRSLL
jgi:3-oxoacyl-[acyl-carrier protein] reductase